MRILLATKSAESLEYFQYLKDQGHEPTFAGLASEQDLVFIETEDPQLFSKAGGWLVRGRGELVLIGHARHTEQMGSVRIASEYGDIVL